MVHRSKEMPISKSRALHRLDMGGFLDNKAEKLVILKKIVSKIWQK